MSIVMVSCHDTCIHLSPFLGELSQPKKVPELWNSIENLSSVMLSCILLRVFFDSMTLKGVKNTEGIFKGWYEDQN